MPHMVFLCLALILTVTVIIYIHYTQTTVEGWDPVAYLYAGEQLAQGHGLRFCHPFNGTIGPYFTLAGFNVRRAGDSACLYLNYPPGFPLLLAVAQRVSIFSHTALYVPALCGVLGVFETFALGILVFNHPAGALFGALSLALAPTYMTFSTAPWSDVPGAVLVIGGIVALLWGNRQKQTSVQIIMGSIGGILVGWGIFTRYVDGLILLPLAAYLWLKHRGETLQLKSVQAFGVCMAVAVLGVLSFNRAYYGGFLTTSYSPQHGWYEWPAFHIQYAINRSPVGNSSLWAVIKTIWMNYSWLLVVSGMGLISMRAPERALALGAILVFAGLYSFYAFPSEGINSRFLVPTFPFISLAIGCGLYSSIPGRWQRWWYAIACLVFITSLFVPLPNRLQRLAKRNENAANYLTNLMNVIENCCEPEAVFLAYNTNDLIAYYGRRTTFFYRRIPSNFEKELTNAIRALLLQNIPVYYVQDANPPFRDSLTVLQRDFDLVPLYTEPPIYRIKRKPEVETIFSKLP